MQSKNVNASVVFVSTVLWLDGFFGIRQTNRNFVILMTQRGVLYQICILKHKINMSYHYKHSVLVVFISHGESTSTHFCALQSDKCWSSGTPESQQGNGHTSLGGHFVTTIYCAHKLNSVGMQSLYTRWQVNLEKNGSWLQNHRNCVLQQHLLVYIPR